MENIILFGNQNLQNSKFKVSSTNSRSNSESIISSQELPRVGGDVVVNKKNASKDIDLKGLIKKPSTTTNTLQDIFVEYDRELDKGDRYLRFMPNYLTINSANDYSVWSSSSGITNLANDLDEFQIDSSVIFDIDVSAGSGAVDTVSFGSEVDLPTSSLTPPIVVYDSNANKCVAFYIDSYDSNKGKAVVGTISDNSISWGTEANINGVDYCYPRSAVFDSSNNKIVIFYRDASTASSLQSRVGTISGTDISFGAETTVIAEHISTCSSVFDTTNNKVVLSYSDPSTENGSSVVGTVSGTSISFGTAVDFTTNTVRNVQSVWEDNSNKVVIVYRDNTDSDHKAIVGTVSGTSISFGTAVQFSASSGTAYLQIVFDSTNNKAVVLYEVANINYGIIGTVSGTSISFGTATSFGEGAITGMSAIYDPVNEVVIVMYPKYSNRYGRVIVGTVSGTSISFGTAVDFLSSGIKLSGDSDYLQSMIYDDNASKFVFVYTRYPSGGMKSIVGNYANTVTSSMESTITSVDLSSIQDTGSFGFWLFLNNISDLESVNIRIGNSNSVYYEQTHIQTNYEGRSLEYGWNFIVLQWSDLQETGTVDNSSIDYLAFDFNYTQVSEDYIDYRFGGIFWIDESEVRNYRAYKKSFTKTYEHWENDQTDYDLTFYVYEGLSFGTFETDLINENVTSGFSLQELVVGGSKAKEFIHNIFIDSDNISTIRLTNIETSEYIEFNQDINAGDLIQVNTRTLNVTKNSEPYEYSGVVFTPSLGRSRISMSVISSSAIDIDWSCLYKKYYL